MTAQATGPLVANDLEGSAVLHADALAPGETTTGEVTIRNAGDAAGAFTLSPSAALDTGAPPAGPLSAVLDLTVTDVSDATPATVFAGKLAALPKRRARHVPGRRRAPLPLRADLPAGHPGRDRQRLPGRVDVDPVRLGRRRRSAAPPERRRPRPRPAPATGSGGATGATAGPAGGDGTAPATSPAAAAAIPATTATSSVPGHARRPAQAAGREGPPRHVDVRAAGASRARVTGTVSWRATARMKLRPTTVKARSRSAGRSGCGCPPRPSAAPSAASRCASR